MAADHVGSEPTLDQTVYRWSWEHLLGRKGMGPVATSLDGEELRGWDGELDHHVSMDRSHPECPTWSMGRVRFKDRYALLLREAAIHGTNRPGTDTHVLLDPGRTVEPHTMLAMVWLHGNRGGGLTGTGEALAEVPEGTRLPAVAIRPDAYDRDIRDWIRQDARRRFDLVEVVLAAVLRDPRKTYALRVADVGDDFVPVLWGVFDLAMAIAPGFWTFSTFETNDGPVKPRFVLVPEWPTTQPPQDRLRIAPELEPLPEDDVFAAAAATLVNLYRTRPWSEVGATLAKLRTATARQSPRECADLVIELEPDYTRHLPAVSAPPPRVGDRAPDHADDGWQLPGPAFRPVIPAGGPPAWPVGSARGADDDADDRPGGDSRRRDPFPPIRPDAPPPETPYHVPPDAGYTQSPQAPYASPAQAPYPWPPQAGLDSTPDSTPHPAPDLPPSPRPDVDTPGRPRFELPGWPVWEGWGATPDGFDALFRAAGALERAGGRESADFRDELEKADLASLVVALRLVDRPLLRHVVLRLDALLRRDKEDNRRPDRHVRPVVAGAVIRLHENIDAIHRCGAPPEVTHGVVWLLARLVVGAGKVSTLGEALAATVWELDRLDWDTTAYQRALVYALWSSRYRDPFLQEHGRLSMEARNLVPRRGDPQR
ncbi:hypothetical protein [Streptomyces sp. SID3343]|uniref:hypothetical protein n=1 Tax=Streptomyces sp. SID3343 TaxID=2690260 RepID=UPI00136F265A|nr:hypothetical protein [Streptomyces sp. SID3343]MYV97712.1 hypothetical protein [Streptomyces sp. SID3343]